MVYLTLEVHRVLKTFTEKVGRLLSCFMVFKNFKKKRKVVRLCGAGCLRFLRTFKKSSKS